jgi:hypothetical protein
MDMGIDKLLEIALVAFASSLLKSLILFKMRETSSRAGPGGGQVERPHRASDFGRAPSNVHVHIILGVVSSMAASLASFCRTILTLR